MRLLSLIFRNLNSLRGDHAVSFTDGPLARAGLFAITGPTGAGKTTILDAITLALYGRAARYDRQQPVDMMTRHTGECFAEAHFECGQGAFGARWELRRSRGKAEGTLQPVKRCVYELSTHKVVADKVKEVDEWIASHTGLDYRRFLRSVLLAQGEFTAFLRASEKDRCQLLENLTGMEVYADLSRLAYQIAKDKRQAWTILQDDAKAFSLLSPEDVENLQRQLAEARHESAKRRDEVERCRMRQACVEQWRQLQDRLQAWTRARQEYVERAEAAEDTLAKLALHRRTESCGDRIRQWKEACRQIDALQRREINMKAEVRQLAESESRSSEALVRVKTEAAGVSRRLGELRDLLEKVLPIDERIALLEEQRATAATRIHELEERLATAREKLGREVHALETSKVDAASLKEWLASHGSDGRLIDLLPQWERRLEAVENLGLRRDQSVAARAAARERLRQIEDALHERRSRIQTEDNRRLQVNKTLEALQATLEAHLGTVPLADWETEQRSLQEQRATLRLVLEKAVQYRDATKQLDSLAKLTAQLESRAADVIGKLRQLGGEIEAQERILVLHRGIAHRDEEIRRLRSELKSGDACPVCGSVEHPGVDQAAPHDSAALLATQEAKLADLQKARERLKEEQIRCEERRRSAHLETEAIRSELLALEEQVATLGDASDSDTWTLSDLSGIEASLRDCESEQIALDKKLSAARELHGTLEARKDEQVRLTFSLQRLQQAVARKEGQLDELAKTIRHHGGEIADLDRRFDEERSALAATLESAGGTKISEPDLRPCLDDLAGKARLFGQKRDEAEQLERRASDLAREVKVHEEETRRLSENLHDSRAESSKVTQSLENLQLQRRELAGNRPLFIERRHFEREEERLRIAKEEAEAALAEWREKREATLALLAQSELERGRLEDERETFVGDLRHAAEQSEFTGIAALLAAHLSRSEVDRMSRVEKALREEHVRLSSQKSELDRSGTELLERGKAVGFEQADLDQSDLQDLNVSTGRAEAALEEVQRHAWDLEESLKRDQVRRQEFAAHQEHLETARRDSLRWEKLNELIGSADGSVFSRFAQGLTLAHLIDLANRHLARLTDRYRLRRQPDTELAIEVVDRYQANAIRSMLSLSGGESFLASLALALGLSELAAGNARIDSLFIDEGFGTLDADSLETAIRALENLQAQQKTVGVISHTELLKERITAQIRVRKGQGGHSSLQVTELTS